MREKMVARQGQKKKLLQQPKVASGQGMAAWVMWWIPQWQRGTVLFKNCMNTVAKQEIVNEWALKIEENLMEQEIPMALESPPRSHRVGPNPPCPSYGLACQSDSRG